MKYLPVGLYQKELYLIYAYRVRNHGDPEAYTARLRYVCGNEVHDVLLCVANLAMPALLLQYCPVAVFSFGFVQETHLTLWQYQLTTSRSF